MRILKATVTLRKKITDGCETWKRTSSEWNKKHKAMEERSFLEIICKNINKLRL